MPEDEKQQDDSLLDELTSDYLPEAEPTGKPEEESEEQVEGEEPKGEDKGEVAKPEKVEPTKPPRKQERKPVVPTEGEEEKYTYKGKTYTVKELVEKGLLKDVFTSAEQFPHIQKKYVDLLEQQKQQPKQDAQQQQPQQPAFDQGRLVSAYKPEVEKAVKLGYIEAEYAEAFPNITSQMLFMRDLLYDVRIAVKEMQTARQQDTQGSEAQKFEASLNSEFDALAAMAEEEGGEYFSPLKDKDVREGFKEYLIELNPMRSQLEGDDGRKFIQRQWIAYNQDVIMEALRSGQPMKVEQKPDKRRLAIGEGTGNHPRVSPQKKTMLDSMVDDVLGPTE